MNAHVEKALIDSLETSLRAKREQVMNLIRERDEARQRLADWAEEIANLEQRLFAAEALLREAVKLMAVLRSDWFEEVKAALEGKL